MSSPFSAIKNHLKNRFSRGMARFRDDHHLLVQKVSKTTFAKRCLITSGIAHAAHGADIQEVVEWLKQEALWNDCSAWEKRFLTTHNQQPSYLNEASWRIERLWALAWVQGSIKSLDHTRPCGAGLSIFYPRPGDKTTYFMEHLELRSDKEIQKERSLLSYLSENTKQRGEAPEGYNEGVIVERSHALDWYLGQSEWAEDLWH